MVKLQYNQNIFNGIAGEFNRNFVESIRANNAAMIDYIEEDSPVQLSLTQLKAPWGLVRVGVKSKTPPTTTYDYPTQTGSGITVCVLDTGIDISHPDFEGRAVAGKSFVSTETTTMDLHGHGTHCAGTIAGKTYGVAKKAKVVAVKVLNSAGSGLMSGVIAGINYCMQTYPAKKTIISMSLGGGTSPSLNDAVMAAYNKGYPVVVAAGNESTDACTKSPSGCPGALAVGAIDNADKLASFSNTGTCVRIVAPGVGITSTAPKNTVKSMSGTSMACPHVAGVMAIYLSTPTYVFSTCLNLYNKVVERGSTVTDLSYKVAYNKLT